MPGLRTRGYREAHEAMGVEVDPARIVASGFDTESGYERTRAMIASSTPFDAIFAFTDGTALGALRALADAGLRVPQEVQLVGFDNTRAARFSVPRLTSVEPANDARAESVVELLVGRLTDPEGLVERRVVMHPATVVERESTHRADER